MSPNSYTDYNDAIRQSILAISDINQAAAEGAGLVFSEYDVRLATETTAGANAAKGQDGTTVTTYKLLDPRPRVDLRTQYRTIDGTPVRVGDALVECSRGAAVRTDFETAAWVEVNGDRYTVVNGPGLPGGLGITELPFTLKVLLARERQ